MDATIGNTKNKIKFQKNYQIFPNHLKKFAKVVSNDTT
jgi:hypothetical protein